MEQMNLYEFLYENYKITKPIRLIELFAGYGSQALALEFLGVPFESYKICEFDKYAIETYNTFHNTNFDPSDITKIHASDLNIVNSDKYEYIMFYSFPCTDLSIAGKMQGMDKGNKTRSGLLWEVERLLNECEELPQILVMENVPQVRTAKGWEDWKLFLESKGYRNFIDILNAKDYYIPQNRQRCFMVSILGDQGFNFPKKMHLDYVLKDILENNVDEKYYIPEERAKTILNQLKDKDTVLIDMVQARREGHPREYKDIAPTLNARDYKEPRLIQVGELDIKGQDIVKRVYDPCGIAPTLTTMQGGNRQPKIIIKDKSLFTDTQIKMFTKDGNVKRYINSNVIDKFEEGDCADISFPNGYNKGNRVFKGYAPTINRTTTASSFVTKISQCPLKIRKLTPSECFKLMGVPNRINKLTPVSNSQQYKQAGNSIVTTVLMAIFGELLVIDWQSKVKELVNEMIENKGDIAA